MPRVTGNTLPFYAAHSHISHLAHFEGFLRGLYEQELLN